MHPKDRVHDGREKSSDKRDIDNRQLCAGQYDNSERDPAQGRDRPKDLNEGKCKIKEGGAPPHQQPYANTEDNGSEESDIRPTDAVKDVNVIGGGEKRTGSVWVNPFDDDRQRVGNLFEPGYFQYRR